MIVQSITVLITIIACWVAARQPETAWIIIGLSCMFIAGSVVVSRSSKIQHVAELSQKANVHLQEFTVFYRWPLAARDFSSSATTLQFASVLVAFVGAFSSYWWGFLWALLVWVLMGYVAVRFNPTNYVKKPEELAAMREVSAWLQDHAK